MTSELRSRLLSNLRAFKNELDTITTEEEFDSQSWEVLCDLTDSLEQTIEVIEQ